MSKVEGVSEEELAALLPEERKALLDGEDGEDGEENEPAADEAEDEEKDDEGETADKDEEAGDEEGEEDADEDDAPPADDDEPAAKEAAPAAQSRPEDEDDDDDQPIVGRFVEDEEWKKASDELVDRFEAKDSEMTLREFTAAQARLQQEAIERSVQSQVWTRDCRRFFRENEAFREEKNPGLYGMFNETVKRVAGDAANANKSGKWLLNEAKRVVSAEIEALTGKSITAPKDDGKPAAKAAAKDEGKRPRAKAPDRTKAPKTLGSLPEAEPGEASGEDADWMAQLDRLGDRDPMKYERALAALPEHKRLAYLGE